MDSAKDQMNAPLPQEILQGNNLTKEEASKHMQTILRQTLPSSDSKNLKADFKWQFFLEQHYVVKLNRRKQKKTFLTRKQRKKMGLLKLPKENWKYSSLQVVRDMWKEYMRENLELIKQAPTCVDQDWNSFSVIVAKSEMVGADLKVVKSKVPSLIGMHGTVVLETKMSFQIVTPQDKLKTILKETSVFEFLLDNMKFTFLGKHLTTRPSERSVKKIRNLMQPDL
ncbi:ribonuclease P protein subunit p29 [Euwallacea similis]|uniref:ribonuclease P protein subunit p29 n=1 Tax=Euwallacea similis TaxID=1736056 RepID=UPI00344D3DF9